MAKALKIGIIGCRIGRQHGERAKESPFVKLTALCDVDRARLDEAGTHLGVTDLYEDYTEMLAKADVEAVMISTPNDLHAPIAIAALEAGKHVYLDKPLANTLEAAQSIVTASEKAKTKLMVGLNYRFGQAAQYIRGLLDEGALGDVYYGHATWRRRAALGWISGWFKEKKRSGGGPVIDLGVHHLDLTWYLMGNPKPVAVSGAVYDQLVKKFAAETGEAFDVENTGLGLIRFENGATCFLEVSWATKGRTRDGIEASVFGTKGGARYFNDDKGYVFDAEAYLKAAGGELVCKSPNLLPKVPTIYEVFARAVLEDKPVSVPASHGLAVQKMLDGLYRSAEAGREVAVE